MRVWLECPYACTGLFADDQHRRVWFLVIKHYLEMRIDVNEKNDCGYTALHYSCQNYEILELLISYGADVNSASDNGTTALMKAFPTGAGSCVRLLLENGANTNTLVGMPLCVHWNLDMRTCRMSNFCLSIT